MKLENKSAEATTGLLEAIAKLLGRMVFPASEIQSIVMKNKRNPLDYIKAYNLCDGTNSVSGIATDINVKKQTLSPILAEWNDIGIVYIIKKEGGSLIIRNSSIWILPRILSRIIRYLMIVNPKLTLI